MNGGVAGAVCRDCLAGSYSSATGGLKIKTSVQLIRYHLSIFQISCITEFIVYVHPECISGEKAKTNKRFVPVYQCLNKPILGLAVFSFPNQWTGLINRREKDKVWLRKTAGISLEEIHPYAALCRRRLCVYTMQRRALLQLNRCFCRFMLSLISCFLSLSLFFSVIRIRESDLCDFWSNLMWKTGND